MIRSNQRVDEAERNRRDTQNSEGGFIHGLFSLFNDWLCNLWLGDWMAEALIAEGAPFGAPQIDARIAHLVLATAADTGRFVFPEFDGVSAMGTADIKNILRLPISHILSRAMCHQRPPWSDWVNA